MNRSSPGSAPNGRAVCCKTRVRRGHTAGGFLISALLLLIMDVNRPQRGMIAVGVAPLERAAQSISAPTN